MATIPRATDIQRVIPGAPGYGGPIDTGAGAIGAGVRSIGRAVGEIAQVAADRRQKKWGVQVSTADASFLIDEHKARADLEGDEDYLTYSERYDKRSKEAMVKWANTITNPEHRTDFLNRQTLVITKNASVVKNAAFQVEKDHWNAALDDALVLLGNIAITPEDATRPLTSRNAGNDDAIAAAETMIDSYRTANYIGEVEGAAKLREFQVNTAISWIEAQPPEKRLGLLDSPMAKHIPPNKLAVLKRAAEQADLASTAELLTQGYADTNMSYGEQIAAVDDLDVADSRLGGRFTEKRMVHLRDEMRRRIRNRKSDQDIANLDIQSDLHLKYYPNIRNGVTNPDTKLPYKATDIPPKDFKMMSPTLRNSMIEAEGQTGSNTVTRTPTVILDRLLQFEAAKDWAGMREYILGREAKGDESAVKGIDQLMTTGHVDRFMSMAYDKSYNPDKRRSFFTTVQTIRSKLEKANKKAGFSAMVDTTSMWIDAIFEDTGKEPNDKQVRDFVDTQLMIDYDWLDQRVYELDEAEREKFYSKNMTFEQRLQYMKSTKPFLYQEVLADSMFKDADDQKILDAMEYRAAN